MSTLINVVQSSRDHKAHRDLEEGRISELSEICQTEHGQVRGQDIRIIRRQKRAEDACMAECKACICLTFTIGGIIYIIALIIVFIAESDETPLEYARDASTSA
jgi:hypothetical protein